jgi:hypothetical protein
MGHTYLVAQFLGPLLQQHVLLPVPADVLLVAEALYVLQLLMGNFQLLLVVVMLLNFGFKVLKLLLEQCCNNSISSNPAPSGPEGPMSDLSPAGCWAWVSLLLGSHEAAYLKTSECLPPRVPLNPILPHPSCSLRLLWDSTLS